MVVKANIALLLSKMLKKLDHFISAWGGASIIGLNNCIYRRKAMSCILHIETSTNVCSVALSQDGSCIHFEEDTKGPSHASVLAPFVESAVSFADSHAIPIDAVAFSEGPGSYTGLRIGSSTAKGLCYGRGLKLIVIPTLKIMATPVLLYRELPEDSLLCPMIDARRMEVYSAVYDRALQEVKPISADVISEDSYAAYLKEHPVYFFGNGAEKCKDVIKGDNAHFIDGIYPSAKNMIPLAEKAIALEDYADVAYFEPFYLKAFVPGHSKRML